MAHFMAGNKKQCVCLLSLERAPLPMRGAPLNLTVGHKRKDKNDATDVDLKKKKKWKYEYGLEYHLSLLSSGPLHRDQPTPLNSPPQQAQRSAAAPLSLSSLFIIGAVHKPPSQV